MSEDRKDWTWRDTMGAVALLVFVIDAFVGAIFAGVAGFADWTWWPAIIAAIVAGGAFLVMIVSFGLIFAYEDRLKKEKANG